MKVVLQGGDRDQQRQLYEAAGIEVEIGGCATEDEMIEMIGDAGVMPIENLDFMGPDEQIPDSVKRFACSVLEEAG